MSLYPLNLADAVFANYIFLDLVFLKKTYPKLEKKSDEIVVQAVKKKLDNKYIVVK